MLKDQYQIIISLNDKRYKSGYKKVINNQISWQKNLQQQQQQEEEEDIFHYLIDDTKLAALEIMLKEKKDNFLNSKQILSSNCIDIYPIALCNTRDKDTSEIRDYSLHIDLEYKNKKIAQLHCIINLQAIQLPLNKEDLYTADDEENQHNPNSIDYLLKNNIRLNLNIPMNYFQQLLHISSYAKVATSVIDRLYMLKQIDINDYDLDFYHDYCLRSLTIILSSFLWTSFECERRANESGIPISWFIYIVNRDTLPYTYLKREKHHILSFVNHLVKQFDLLKDMFIEHYHTYSTEQRDNQLEYIAYTVHILHINQKAFKLCCIDHNIIDMNCNELKVKNSSNQDKDIPHLC